MISRRELLISAISTAAVAVGRPWTAALGSASQPASRIAFRVPRGACDCHVHIFGDPQRFPFSATRTYTPEPASIAELLRLHRALHTDRVVIVTPSVYGTDNSCTLDAVRRVGSSARAIAVIDGKISETELDEMDRAGVRGIRINLETGGQADPAIARQRFQAGVEQIQRRKNWHIQVYARLSVIEALRDWIRAAPVPVVLDHFAGAKAASGLAQPGFQSLLQLLRSGAVYVKLSAAYRCSTLLPDYPDVVPLAQALIAANPRRILWGTDWPHPATGSGSKTKTSPLLQIDDARLLNQFGVWAAKPAQRTMILVNNPANLYGF